MLPEYQFASKQFRSKRLIRVAKGNTHTNFWSARLQKGRAVSRGRLGEEHIDIYIYNVSKHIFISLDIGIEESFWHFWRFSVGFPGVTAEVTPVC